MINPCSLGAAANRRTLTRQEFSMPARIVVEETVHRQCAGLRDRKGHCMPNFKKQASYTASLDSVRHRTDGARIDTYSALIDAE
jgi:hypothetical protein